MCYFHAICLMRSSFSLSLGLLNAVDPVENSKETLEIYVEAIRWKKLESLCHPVEGYLSNTCHSVT